MAIARRSSSLRKKSPGDPILASDYNALIDEIGRLGTWSCAGNVKIFAQPGGMGIDVGSLSPAIFVNITSSTQDGSNKRWIYSGNQVEKLTAGYGTWTTKSGGITFSGNLFNLMEDGNGASGTFTNGVQSSNLGSGFDLVPLASGAIAVIVQKFIFSGTDEYWFSPIASSVDGACP